MKITFDIDCTPQEARAFLGLPDLSPLHNLYLDKMKGFIEDAGSADFEKMTKAWLPGMTGNLESWRQAFWPTSRDKSEG